MTFLARLYPKNLSLDALKEQLALHEDILGPLVVLGRNKDRTVAAYKGGLHPSRELELLLAAGGVAVVPATHTKVCEGLVWISGQEQAVVAIRRKA